MSTGTECASIGWILNFLRKFWVNHHKYRKEENNDIKGSVSFWILDFEINWLGWNW